MKEQIKLLAMKAHLGTADFDNGSYYVATPDKLEQFVELIVQECMDVADKNEPLNTWTKRYSQLIKEHFGFE